MLTTLHTRSTIQAAAALTLATGLYACSSDDDERAQGPSNSANVVSEGALLVITEREDTSGMSLHYLHVLKEWPSSGELDYDQAVELGAPVVAFVQDKALYAYHAQAGTIEKITLDANGNLKRGQDSGDEISFVGKGISGFSAEPVRMNANVAFLIDEKTAQIARWNPTKMEIESVEPINGDVLSPDGLELQFQLGVAAGSRVFTTTSWRTWEPYKVQQEAALGVFSPDAPGDVQLVSDERCAPSVSIGPFTDDGYVYLVSDGANGYDLLASPEPVKKPQCVVRMKPDASAFDKDYFIDLQELTKSPAIYTTYPMKDHKLLVNQWSPDEEVEKYRTTKDAAWFWDAPPTYEHVIVDLVKKTVSKVELPLAAARSRKTLIVDDENYVQIFRDDKGTDLYRVSTTGKTTKVLASPGSTNVQFLGRL